MAGTKRVWKDVNSDIPTPKRHNTRSSHSKNNNCEFQSSKTDTQEARTGGQKHVAIDLSADEEIRLTDGSKKPVAVMKNQPPHSTSDEFPLFRTGSVHIILDPRQTSYQYRLHRTTLSRISPAFAKLLGYNTREASKLLKASTSNAHSRFELVFSQGVGEWILRKVPFTMWKHPRGLTQEDMSNDTPKASISPEKYENENLLLIREFGIRIESEESSVIAKSPSIPSVVPSGIVVDNITTIRVAKDQIRDHMEDVVNEDFAIFGHEDVLEIQSTQAFSIELLESSVKSTSRASAENGDYHTFKIDRQLVKLDVNLSEANNESLTACQSLARPVPHLCDLAGDKAISQGDELIKTSPAVKEEEMKASNTLKGQGSSEQKAITIPPATSGNDLIEVTTYPEKSTDMSVLEKECIIVPSFMIADAPEMSDSLTERVGLHSQPDRKAISSNGTPLSPPADVVEAYNNLFLIFYNQSPKISTTCISVALKQCEDIMSAAEHTKTMSVVRPYLGNAIGRFSQQLCKAIAAEPYRWLSFSMVIESAIIFKEAIIHIVGTYVPGEDYDNTLPATIPLSVQDLIILKIRELNQKRMDANERLFNSSITINSKIVTFSSVDPEVVSTWIVVQVWRDWFCQQIGKSHLNPHRTGSLYRTLQRSGDDYLPSAMVKAVVENIRHPVEVNFDELKQDLNMLKMFAQDVVQGLCENHSMLDIRDSGIEHLTCTIIMDDNLPWFEPSLI